MRIISTPEIPDSHLAFTNNNWFSIVKRGYHMLTNNSNESKIDWSDKQSLKLQSVMSIYRGRNLNEIENNSVNSLCTNNYPYTNFTEKFDANEINQSDKHLTILNNSNFLEKEIKQTLIKSLKMFEFKAFVHQYEKYGMDHNDFLDAFAFCEQILFDYNNLII